MTTQPLASRESRARANASPLGWLLAGALVVASLEAVDAVIAWRLVRGVPAIRIFQGVYGGLVGSEAFRGGWRSAATGAALHYLIALAVVGVFALALWRFEILVRHLAAAGMLYGAGVYLVMSRIVVPLSALGGGGFSWPLFWNGVLGHALLVGLPSALFARAALAARRGRVATP